MGQPEGSSHQPIRGAPASGLDTVPKLGSVSDNLNSMCKYSFNDNHNCLESCWDAEMQLQPARAETATRQVTTGVEFSEQA